MTPIDYSGYLALAGYKLTNELAANNDPALGIGLVSGTNRVIVASVARGSAAWIDGINVNDEITAIDGVTLTTPIGLIAGKKPGDKIMVTVLRDGLTYTLPVILLKSPRVRYKIEELPKVTAQQLSVRKKWLTLK